MKTSQSLVKGLCTPCDSNQSISIGFGAADVWLTFSAHRCPVVGLSAKHGFSATAMTIRVSLPMDRSKDELSINC